MNTITTTTTPVTDQPIIDSPLDAEVADRLGNEMLLGIAAGEKVQRVSGTRASSFTQSGESRAWTSAGNVD